MDCQNGAVYLIDICEVWGCRREGFVILMLLKCLSTLAGSAHSKPFSQSEEEHTADAPSF